MRKTLQFEVTPYEDEPPPVDLDLLKKALEDALAPVAPVAPWGAVGLKVVVPPPQGFVSGPSGATNDSEGPN
jgi:hypothetical protein